MKNIVMKDLLDNKWYKIPGFQDYEINNKGRIRSYKSGSGVLLKKNTTVKLNRDGNVYKFTVHNVLFAVKHDVSPEQVQGLCFVPDGNGGQYMTRADCCEIMMKRSAARRKISSEQVDEDLEKTERLINLIREYHKTNDIHDVACYLNSFKQEIISYLFKKQYTSCINNAEECWGMVIEIALSGIKERNRSILEPVGYLKRISRNLIALRRRTKRMMKSYDENDYSMGTYY